MKNRRDFLKGTAVAATVLAMGSAKEVLASSPAFTGIVYTKDNPGTMAKKIGSHAPQVIVAGGKVTVFTKHGMAAKHFIVRHTVVLADGTVVGSKTFSATDAEAKSSFDLPAGYSGTLYATSFCNLHDLWMTESKA